MILFLSKLSQLKDNFRESNNILPHRL